MAKRKRKGRKEPSPIQQKFEAGGLLLEQDGRYLHVRNTGDDDAHKKLTQELGAWAEKYPEESERIAGELEALLRQFNTFDVLAHVSFANLFFIPDNFDEPSHEGLSAYVEFIALVALRGSFVEAQVRDPSADDLEKIQDLVGQVFSMRLKYVLAQRRSEEGNRPRGRAALETLRFAVQQNELMVRGPAYPIHFSEVLEGLFGPYDSELKRLGGFSSRTAIELGSAMRVLVSRRLEEKGKLAKRRTRDLFRRVRARKRDKSVDTGLPERLVRALIQFPDREIRRRLRALAMAWLFHEIGQTSSFTASDLANELSISVDEVESILGLLSAEFGSVDREFCTPLVDHILKRRPLIHHRGRYQCPTPVLLEGALAPTMEGLLTTETRLGNRYRKHRHDYLLRRGVKCLQRILPGATADINLHYEFEGVRPELDALVQYDSVLILLEAKGAPLTPPARRGAPDRLERDLRRIVSDAHAQGHRAYRFLREGSGRFLRGDGTAMQVDLGSFEEVFVVSLHLEPLGHLTALSHAVEAMGLPTDGPEQSWMVSLYDLMVLSDVLDIPSMFPHYAKRRLRVGRQGVIDAHDELDFFCYYLQEGLYFDDEDLGGAQVLDLQSHTVPLDDYYFFVQGHRRRRAEKPRQKMIPEFESFIRKIEASKLAGRTSVNMALLDQSGRSRKAFSKGMLKTKKRFARDHDLHDFSLHFKREGGWGVTFMCGPEDKTGILRQFCTRKRDELDAIAWYGIADCGRRSVRICELVSV